MLVKLINKHMFLDDTNNYLDIGKNIICYFKKLTSCFY